MRPHLEDLSDCATTHVSCYPNAGLPNPLAPTGFDLDPEHMAEFMAEFAAAGLLNLAGGCCGNTPEHIAAIARAVARHIAPRGAGGGMNRNAETQRSQRNTQRESE